MQPALGPLRGGTNRRCVAARGMRGAPTPPHRHPHPPLQAREAELKQWEQDVAVSRSQGQFFQSLYQV